MANEEPVVFSPDTVPVTELNSGETMVIDMANQKVIFGDSKKHEHDFEVLPDQDPTTPHLTYVQCKVCSLGQILKTGDNFSEKDILKADGKISRRKSPLTNSEKTLTQKYQKDVKDAIHKNLDAGKGK